LALLLAAAAAVGLAHLWAPTPGAPPCEPSDYRWIDAGAASHAVCERGAPAAPAPAGVGLTLGVPLALNRASEAELALVPGIGKALANRLVRERLARGGFKSWAEVEAVPGIGPSKLSALKAHADVRP
jgi:competence protein ComEA